MPSMDYSHWAKAGYLSAADVSRVLRLPGPTVHRWMRTGKLAFQLQGRRHFVKVSDLAAFVRMFYTDQAVAESIVDEATKALTTSRKRKKRGKA